MDTPTQTEMPETDELLTAAAAGQESALAMLFDRHRPHLERMIRLRLDSRLRSRVDPSDILQETYIAIQRKFPKYVAESDLPLLIWLRLETGQKMVETYRRHFGTQMRNPAQEISLHRGSFPSVASVTLAAQLLGRVSTASKALMRTELKLKVQEALNSMEPHDREVLVLRHFEELSNAEVALMLGISPTAACNRYVRALKRLKIAFEEMPGGIEGILS